MEHKDELKDINAPNNVATESTSTNTINQQNSNSIATKANLEPSATVKFVFMPIGQVVTLAKPLTTQIYEFIVQFSNDLKIEAEFLQIIHSASSKLTKQELEFTKNKFIFEF